MADGPSRTMLEPYPDSVRNPPADVIIYDRDLRIVLADGELLRTAGYSADLLRGQLLSDVLPRDAYRLLEPRYRETLAGIEQDLDYVSPVSGRLFRTRGRPVRDDTGEVIAALLLTWDVLERGVLEAQIATGVANAAQRDLLLRQVCALLETSIDSAAETLPATAELAATAVGDGCVLRTLSADRNRVETVAVAHRTIEGRAQLEDWTRTYPTEVRESGAALIRAAWSAEGHHGVIEPGDPAYPARSWGLQYVIAPASFHGKVRGTIALFRPGDAPGYDDAGLHLLRVLADRIAALLEADRAGAWGLRLTAELQQINADQRNLVLQLDSTESRERGRLADAVHDDPLQLAVAALLRLDSYRAGLSQADPSGDVIDGIANMLESCVEQLRTLIGTLTPPDLSRGLGPALRQLAEGLFLGTEVGLRVRGPDHVHLDPSTKETIYRILREALVNARKHAHATTVTLDLTEDPRAVTLLLTDDGVGLPGANNAADAGMAFGHLGMSSMRARAAAANARLTVRGAVGGGTVVELVIPRHVEGKADAVDADASPTSGAGGSGPSSAVQRG